MSNKPNPTMIGVFVIGAVALIVAGILLLGAGRVFRDASTYVMYFETSISGLDVGSPVEFNGARVGSVKNIQLVHNPADESFHIPVTISIERDRICCVGEEDPKTTMLSLIKRGMRAQLQSVSLVTGQMSISLVMRPEQRAKFVGADSEYPEIPTIPTQVEALTRAIEELPLAETVKDLHAILASFSQIIQSDGAQQAIPTLNTTVRDIGCLATNMMQKLGPAIVATTQTNTRMQETLTSLKEAIEELTQLVDRQSPLRHEVEQALVEIAEAARSLRILTDYLARHPESLIKGKQTESY